MSFDNCRGWPEYCYKFTCYPIGKGPLRPASNWGECFSTVEENGPFNFSHQIRTNYSLEIFGLNIPIVNTTRDWSTYEYWRLAVPSSIHGVWFGNGTAGELTNISWCFNDFTKESLLATAKEDCTIVKSTLHYLDHRFKVCLYRKNIERIKFDVQTDQTNLFKTPFNTVRTPSIKIFGGDKKNWDSTSTEEWHLIVDGVDRLIATSTYDPLPEMGVFAVDGSEDLFNPNYAAIADKDLELILSTAPPTSSDAMPWDDELRYHGFYSYRGAVNSTYWTPDGGCADYFYPAWCRALHEDPFWKDAAELRAGAASNPFFDGSYEDTTYTPDIDLIVDPIPLGTYVKHPVVGEVYQFLVGLRGGGYKLETSPNIDDIINNAVPEDQRQQGTTLYYPIGVL